MELTLEHTRDPLREQRAELARLRERDHTELADIADRLYWALNSQGDPQKRTCSVCSRGAFLEVRHVADRLYWALNSRRAREAKP